MNTWIYSHVGRHKSQDYPLSVKHVTPPSQLPGLPVQEPVEAVEQSVSSGSSLTFFLTQVGRKPTWRSQAAYTGYNFFTTLR